MSNFDLKVEQEDPIVKYVKCLRLLVKWAVDCDFGLDNIRNDEVVDWESFERVIEEEDFEYTDCLIYYASLYLDNSDEPYIKRINEGIFL